MSDETDNKPTMPKKNKGTDELPFGKILRSIMQERKLTLKQMAELSGVGTSVVQNWLEGKNPHDLKAVSRLAQSLGISFKGLLMGEAETINKPTTLAEIFNEQDLFEGVCKISIKRLLPRGGEEK